MSEPGAHTGPAIELTTPLGEVASIPKRVVAGLRALGVANVGQLVAYLPARHEREEGEAGIGELTPDAIVTARGEVTATRIAGARYGGRGGAKARFEAVLMDATGRLDLVWFNAAYLHKRLHPGMRLRVQGKAKRFAGGLQIANPKFEVIADEAGEPEPREREARLRPVYPASERVSSPEIERAVASVLDPALGLIDDHLPAPFRREKEVPELRAAYGMMHAPEDDAQIGEARRRLAYDELLLLQLGVFMRRKQLRERLKAPALAWNEEIDARIRERIPFTLTASQEHVVKEIMGDITGEAPMNRLVQGDVGAGKTVVALYAMLMAVAAGHQAALMAPTEVLAEQHLASISGLLEGSRVRVELLTGTLAESDRASVLARLERGEIDILVGTHALLTERVRFNSLAFVVIDEQHRFGVHQRAALRTKGTSQGEAGGGAEEGVQGRTPHVLVMTATPIPRTLTLTLLGDLDVSTIRGMPPGRTPVTTRLVPPNKRDEVYRWVRERLEAGDQAFVVTPSIESSRSERASGGGEVLSDLRSVQRHLEEGELAGRRIAALHGRLKRRTREHVMGRFRAGLIDALVATTVIEVGVDVPNATVMVIEAADRFGLAQLHQLRGRVGRGRKRSACVLIGEATTDEARLRLEAVVSSTDGFVLAEKDLEIRGPGEVFGLRQSGVPPFRVADLMRDRELLAMARRDARAWIERSPDLDAPEEALLRRRLLKAHGRWLGLGDVG